MGLVVGALLFGQAMAFGNGGGDALPLMQPIVVEPEKSATLPELMASLSGERVVYVGETHTAWGDHLLQLEVLKAMATQPGELALGVEWFQAPFQPVVDRYLAGEIDESEFLRDTQYYQRWRFDYRLYRPIVEFARENAIPIIALNASRELTNEISKVGIDALPEALKGQLPAEYDFSDKAYEASLREMFKLHQAEDAQFQRFLEAQLTWDETMAQNAAAWLEGGPQRRMLVLAGTGHVSGRSGIPNRVTRRTGVQGKTIATFSPGSRLFNTADYMILANEQSLPPAGIMRVILDERDGGLFVKGFSQDSPAEAAGLREGDRITAIDGATIDDFMDLKVLMLDRKPGDEIEVTFERKRFFSGMRSEAARFTLAAANSAH
jgi:uncharacterized iron-regulated protein